MSRTYYPRTSRTVTPSFFSISHFFTLFFSFNVFFFREHELGIRINLYPCLEFPTSNLQFSFLASANLATTRYPIRAKISAHLSRRVGIFPIVCWQERGRRYDESFRRIFRCDSAFIIVLTTKKHVLFSSNPAQFFFQNFFYSFFFKPTSLHLDEALLECEKKMKNRTRALTMWPGLVQECLHPESTRAQLKATVSRSKHSTDSVLCVIQ